jgi:hypothetical protein
MQPHKPFTHCELTWNGLDRTGLDQSIHPSNIHILLNPHVPSLVLECRPLPFSKRAWMALVLGEKLTLALSMGSDSQLTQVHGSCHSYTQDVDGRLLGIRIVKIPYWRRTIMGNRLSLLGHVIYERGHTRFHPCRQC